MPSFSQVRMSAFQALGPFISTFANPNTTGLYFDEDGILRVNPEVEQPANSLVDRRIEQVSGAAVPVPVDSLARSVSSSVI